MFITAFEDEYLTSLRTALVEQLRAESGIIELLRDVVTAALAHDWNNTPVSTVVPYKLKRFGSRAYKNAVMTSDLDIVVELPSWLHTRKLSPEVFLKHALAILKANRRCTAVQDQVEVKTTVRFRFLDMCCDLTVCCGHALEVHGPSMFTKKIDDALNQVPGIRDLACLVVDHALRDSIAWKGIGSI